MILFFTIYFYFVVIFEEAESKFKEINEQMQLLNGILNS